MNNHSMITEFIANGNKGYAWSKYQIDLIWQIYNSNQSVVVKAVPGSGKTTVLADLLAKLLPRLRPYAKFLFLAFNNSIQEELKDRLPVGFESTGINKLGYKILRHHTGQAWNTFHIESGKTHKIVSSYVWALPEFSGVLDDVDKSVATATVAALTRTMDLCLSSMVTPSRDADSDFAKLVEIHNLAKTVYEHIDELTQMILMSDLFATSSPKEGDSKIISASRKGLIDNWLMSVVLAKCGSKNRAYEKSRNKTWISFTDQIRIPVLRNMTSPNKYDVIMVDEAQDFNQIMLGLVKLVSSPNVQLIAVGDQNQSIYGFAGALSNSLSVVTEMFNCVEMPLYETYRLPVSHVKYAANYLTFGELVGFKKNEGTLVEDLENYDVPKLVAEIVGRGEEALVLSGRNVNVTKAAFQFLAMGIPCAIINREFNAVTKMVTNVAYRGKSIKRGVTLENLPEHMWDWYEKELQALRKIEAGEDDFQALEDKLRTFEVFYQNVEGDDIPTFLTNVEKLFANENVKVRLSTVHRAKGLECENVIIVAAQTITDPRDGLSEEQEQQFKNVGLVAFTRSKNNMYISFSRKDDDDE